MKMLTALAAGGVVAASIAQAATLTFSGTVPLRSTTWSETISVSRFDASLGTLTAIRFVYGGSIETGFQAESLSAGEVALQSLATLTFDIPGSSAIVVDTATAFTASAFDGSIDFAGASGFDTGASPITDTDADTAILLSGFAPYVGAGSFGILVNAVGQSSTRGPGNVVAQIETQAGATITVEYTYSPDFGPTVDPIPVPPTLVLLGASLIALAGRRRSA